LPLDVELLKLRMHFDNGPVLGFIPGLQSSAG
jgi:hypothetical protein